MTSPNIRDQAGEAASARVFAWPLAKPVEIVRAFDLPDQPWLAGHRGVDLRAAPGAEVLAPATGTISFNGWIVDRHVLVIKHGELASTLEPVLSDLAVGVSVGRGATVGAVASGEAWHCQNCLHWGVRRGDQYLDPTLLADPRPRAVLWR
jgi:murein DD-endopeptidase MepM/ murein hydrolase activator NlpD